MIPPNLALGVSGKLRCLYQRHYALFSRRWIVLPCSSQSRNETAMAVIRLLLPAFMNH